MNLFGEMGGLSTTSKVLVDSALVGVGGMVEATMSVGTRDLRELETVSAPVADLLKTTTALVEAPDDSTVSVLDIATKMETVRLLPEEEKLAVASLSPDLAKLITTIDASPSLAHDLIGTFPYEPPTTTLPGTRFPPIVTTPPIGLPPIIPLPPQPLPPILPLPPIQPPPPPPPGQPSQTVYVQTVNAQVLTQLRTRLEAEMPRAQGGATITAESFNALRKAILDVVDGVLSAAAQAVSPVPTTPLPLPAPLPTPPLRTLEQTELIKVHDVLSKELIGSSLLKVLTDRGVTIG